MGLVKSILGEIHHIVIDLIGYLLTDTVFDTAGNSGLLITINKTFAFCLHDRVFLFGHGTPQDICTAQRISSQITNDLHDLFLINDTSVSWFQDWLKLRTIVHDFFPGVLACYIFWNKIHRTRTIQCNSCDNILQCLRTELPHETLHTRTF